MQLDSITNCKIKNKKAFFVAKIEDYNLTKQKYFEYIQLYKNKKIKSNSILYAVKQYQKLYKKLKLKKKKKKGKE